MPFIKKALGNIVDAISKEETLDNKEQEEEKNEEHQEDCEENRKD